MQFNTSVDVQTKDSEQPRLCLPSYCLRSFFIKFARATR
jgi:hypothetical protein